MNKKKLIGKLIEFFADKEIPTYREYIHMDGIPIKGIQLKRVFGSWNRMLKMMEREKLKRANAKPVAVEPKAAKPKAKPAKKGVVKDAKKV